MPEGIGVLNAPLPAWAGAVIAFGKEPTIVSQVPAAGMASPNPFLSSDMPKATLPNWFPWAMGKAPPDNPAMGWSQLEG